MCCGDICVLTRVLSFAGACRLHVCLWRVQRSSGGSVSRTVRLQNVPDVKRDGSPPPPRQLLGTTSDQHDDTCKADFKNVTTAVTARILGTHLPHTRCFSKNCLSDSDARLCAALRGNTQTKSQCMKPTFGCKRELPVHEPVENRPLTIRLKSLIN